MSHDEQRKLVSAVKQFLVGHFSKSKVLEVGSLDINGSIRKFFDDCNYTGVDISEGAGVDRVGQGQLLDFPTGSFDTVISCECLEHNPYWSETVSNMLRMLRPGGLIVVTCATIGRPEHGTTRSLQEFSPLTNKIGWDYYRNLAPEDLQRAINLHWWLEDYILGCNWDSSDLYLIGVAKGGNAQALQTLRAKLTEMNRIQTLRGYWHWALGTLTGDLGARTIWLARRSVGRLKRRILSSGSA